MLHNKIADIAAHDFIHKKARKKYKVEFRISWNEILGLYTVYPNIYPVHAGGTPWFRDLGQNNARTLGDVNIQIEKHLRALEGADFLDHSG